MKTPTTITVIAWNYCQNRCTYCVSESNKEEWKLNGKTEVWKPEGDEHLNFYELCEEHGFGFHEEICPEPHKYLDAKDVLEYEYAIQWIKKYRPDAHIHISGGEPLLRPDIEDMVIAFSKHFTTTIVTNGQLISRRPKLLDLPVKWLVTWHQGQVSLYKFLAQIELIKDKPHMINTILNRQEKSNVAQYFEEYNFEYKYDRLPKFDRDFKYNPEDLNDIASNRIMLIQPNGPVEGCNKSHRGTWDRYKSHSNVYNMTCDEDKLAMNNDRSLGCVMNNRCAAYQTAVKMSRL